MISAAAARLSQPNRGSDHGSSTGALDLVPYANCPGRQSQSCRFAAEPQISLAVPELNGATVRVHRCSTCGVGVTRPAMPDVTPLYEGRNSEDFQQRDSSFATKVKALAFGTLARRLLRRLPGKPANVIDFGCGNGLLTAAFAKELPTSQVVGLDFFEEAPDAIAPARYASFGQSKALEAKADLLLCFHALEHDDDPHAFLDRLKTFVAPGGVMVTEVPNVDCVWTPWFGSACNNWYLPYHRLHFSRRSLRDLMEANGLTILFEQDVCSATIAMSLSRRLGMKYNGAFFIAGLLFRPVQHLAELLTRRPSALRIVVRRN